MLPVYVETDNRIAVFYKKSCHIPPHIYRSLEFVYITEGTLELGVGEELYHMDKGDLGVIFPDLIHHYQVFSEGRNEALHIAAAPSLCGEYASQMAALCPRDPVITASKLHPDAKYAVEGIWKEWKEKGRNSSEPVLEAFLHLILARCMPELSLMDKESVGSKDLIYRAVSYISSHFREKVTLTSMAHDLGESPYVLSRVFSGTFHRNFNRYLNETRLSYACAILTYTDRSILDAAMDAGFDSQRTFNRVFRELYRMTPREWKKENRSDRT